MQAIGMQNISLTLGQNPTSIGSFAQCFFLPKTREEIRLCSQMFRDTSFQHHGSQTSTKHTSRWVMIVIRLSSPLGSRHNTYMARSRGHALGSDVDGSD